MAFGRSDLSSQGPRASIVRDRLLEAAISANPVLDFAHGQLRSFLDEIKNDTDNFKTITSLSHFTEELELVRKQGYAISDEEFAEGNRAIAVPILDQNGFALASVNIAVQTKYYSREDLEKKLLAPLLSTAKDISMAWQHLDTPVDIGEYL